VPLFGFETEYAVSGLGRNGARRDQEALVRRLLGLAKNQVAALPDAGGWGLFLSNGGRFYVDSGFHPELATPEVSQPADLVKYIVAGEQFLARLIQQVERDSGGKSQVACFRCNVDYGAPGSTTWGCHESYLYRAEPLVMPCQLIPHLVTRIIYTGSGGFNSTSLGVRFLLSPRVPHLVQVISSNSTSERGIFHDKDEPLNGKGFHRLHVLAGESLASHRAIWLKAATTALIVELVNAGFEPGAAVTLQAPLQAMWTVASDPDCKAPITLADGSESSAIAVQRHYLSLVEKHLEELRVPDWGAEACREWCQTLDRLEKGPESLAPTLDWPLKLQIYRRRARNRGMSWESLTRWNPVVERLQAALRHTRQARERVTAGLLLGPQSPVREDVQALTPTLASQGLEWGQLDQFLALRRELCEIDMRFGQLSEQSIFAKLDRAGVLSHRVPGVDHFEDAVAGPPPYGRARIRGEVIARLAGQNERYICDWQAVWDQVDSRVLDLSDPFSTEEHWREVTGFEAENDLFSLFGPPFSSAWLRRIRPRNST
jgi:proteasome accessory factor A